jgi:hypothetical protein
MQMKKLTKKERTDMIFAIAKRFIRETELAGLSCHEQADVCALLLTSRLPSLMRHRGIVAVDDMLGQFVLTLGACTEPLDKDDEMIGVKISLRIETNESV